MLLPKRERTKEIDKLWEMSKFELERENNMARLQRLVKDLELDKGPLSGDGDSHRRLGEQPRPRAGTSDPPHGKAPTDKAPSRPSIIPPPASSTSRPPTPELVQPSTTQPSTTPSPTSPPVYPTPGHPAPESNPPPHLEPPIGGSAFPSPPAQTPGEQNHSQSHAPLVENLPPLPDHSSWPEWLRDFHASFTSEDFGPRQQTWASVLHHWVLLEHSMEFQSPVS